MVVRRLPPNIAHIVVKTVVNVTPDDRVQPAVPKLAMLENARDEETTCASINAHAFADPIPSEAGHEPG
jgi:hypothetical protein